MDQSPPIVIGGAHHETGGGDQLATTCRSYALSGKILLSTIVVLFSIVLLLLCLHFYVRYHVLRRARRRHHLALEENEHFPSAARHALDPSVLKSLPVLLCGPAGSGEIGGSCPVCLEVFEEGEKIRSLPRCGHCFHIACIDMWLGSQSNCPLCRAAVEETGGPAADFTLGTVNDNVIHASSSDSRGRDHVMEVENGGHGSNRRSNWSSLVRWIQTRDVLPHRIGVFGTEVDLERGGAPAPLP
ncbi:hypothetical protein HPP92_011566 [Vanilla planifolia]|uniref:RING-type E3 ubiquitin transferase n=1 Tax=Vanilla planifolia TaxID=51239 RepID=A0A835RBT3_VANPL|nr:hypothetical protein HPP92_011566 [Vanilla planifolia]